MLLDAAQRSRLERLALHGKRRLRGVWSGRHRSMRLGESLDFADYREYFPGDDFRRIDYNLWARLGSVLIRVFEAEEEAPVRVLVDASASMEFAGKFQTAQKMAAVVSYLSLASGERVRLATVPGPDRRSLVGPWGRHVAAWPQMEAWLEQLQPAGGTDLPGAARLVIGSGSLRGPAVMISDLLAAGWQRSVDLLGTGAGGVVVHVLAPQELNPDLTGDLTLRDVETREELAVSMDGRAVSRYRERLDSFITEARARARRAGMDYVLVPAGPNAAEPAIKALIEAGAVR